MAPDECHIYAILGGAKYVSPRQSGFGKLPRMLSGSWPSKFQASVHGSKGLCR